jgi:energy-coupling factor transporter ATP-binding protein EcfA2
MPPLIRRVSIKDYKSISRASVELGSFAALVGPNGSGKSNFVDALAFVSDSLSNGIELAFRNRGGITVVRRLSTGHPTHIGIRLVIELSETTSADYAFEIAAERGEPFSVSRERCVVREVLGAEHRFEVERGVFTIPIAGLRPRIAPDRLALFAASGIEEFRPLYDSLVSVETYSIVPDRLREYQEPDPGDKLNRDGSNAAAVLRRLQMDPSQRGTYELLMEHWRTPYRGSSMSSTRLLDRRTRWCFGRTWAPRTHGSSRP